MPNDKKRKFGIFKILGIAAALLLATFIAIPFLLDANQFRPKLESELTGALGREVKVGNLKLALLSGGVEADDIAIADDPVFSRSPLVHAKSLRVGVELKPLIFSRVVHITGVTLEQPEITLIRSASGDWNFSNIGGKSSSRPSEKQGGPSGTNISISSLQVTNGKVTVIRGGGHSKPRVYDRVNVNARELSFTSSFPFTLTATLPGGGSVKLEGMAGPINSADASLTPITASLAMTHFDIIASGFIEPDSGLTALVDFNGSMTSDGKRLESKGRAKANKVKIVKGGAPAVQPISLEYSLNHHLKSQSGTLSEAKVEFGKAVAQLSGSYDMRGESTILKMKLRGENMPAEDLEALLPAIGVTLPKGASLQGGTLNADLAIEGPVEKLEASGTAGIVNTRLTGFDLGAKMAAVASLAGIKSSSVTEIEKFTSDMRVAPDGIQVSNLLLSVPTLGQLTGNGTVGSNYSLDFKMLARLNASGSVVGSLAHLAGVKGSNELNVPFFIRGTTLNPTFLPDVKGAAGSLLESSVAGKDTKAGETKPNQNLGGLLRGLLEKKKK